MIVHPAYPRYKPHTVGHRLFVKPLLFDRTVCFVFLLLLFLTKTEPWHNVKAHLISQVFNIFLHMGGWAMVKPLFISCI